MEDEWAGEAFMAWLASFETSDPAVAGRVGPLNRPADMKWKLYPWADKKARRQLIAQSTPGPWELPDR
jgi:hypothetical protein